MIVGSAAVELDGQVVAVKTDGADGGRSDGDQCRIHGVAF